MQRPSLPSFIDRKVCLSDHRPLPCPMGPPPHAIWSKGKICRWVDMIFVTVGNDFRSFDRLLRKMDEIAPRIPAEVVIQKGYSRYHPENVTHFDFVPMSEAIEYIKKSELVVSHAGIGTIILCMQYGIPLLILPRRKSYREHMNDHQMEIARSLEERRSERIFVAYEADHLEEKILSILKQKIVHAPIQNMGRENLIRTIKKFIDMTF